MSPPFRSISGIAALLLASGACATAGAGGPRADFGHIAVTAEPAATNTQVITTFNFDIEENRISELQPGNSTHFDYTLSGDGCLRGPQLQEYCRASSLSGDKPGSQRWRATQSQETFTTRLSDDGNTLYVDYIRARGVFALGTGPAVDEIRREPWMLGIAFIRRGVPAATAQGMGSMLDYQFRVTQSP